MEISWTEVLKIVAVILMFIAVVAIAFTVNAVWWLVVTLPLLKSYKQTNQR